MSEFYVDSVLYDGRPKDRRIEKEERVYDLLDELGIEYKRADHSPADTIEDCQIIEEVIGVQICKNLFLCNRQETQFYILLMPALKPFRTAVVSKLLGVSRLSFGKPEYMEEFLDITPGSVSIMGLMNDKNNRVQLVVDKDIYESDYIRCHPCINTSTLKIKTSDIFEKYLPRVRHKPIVIDIKSWEE
jgi:Ala-tRNA(Pro) deacylase